MISRKNRLIAIILSAILLIATTFIGATAAPKRVTIKSLTVGKTAKTVKVTIKKFKGAKGYQIRYGYKKNLKGAKVSFVKKRTVTLKKLKKGKTLYVKVRAKLKNGYSKYSAVKKVKLQKATEKATFPITHGPINTVPTVPPFEHINGNPTDAFIASCAGFTLKYLNPWEGPELGSPLFESKAFAEQIVEADYRCTIEEVGLTEDYKTAIMASLSAGTPQAHIYRVPSDSFVSFLDKDYLCDLNGAIKKAGINIERSWFDSTTQLFNIDGKQYAWYENTPSPYKLYYNKNLIKETNLYDPLTLVKSGKWTWDAFANGYSQVSPLAVQDNSSELLLKAMVASQGLSVSRIQKGKTPTTDIVVPGIEASFTALAKWSADGVVSYDEQSAKSFCEGEIAFYYGDGSILDSIDKDKFASEIGVVPFPKPNEYKTAYYSLTIPTYASFIPKQYARESGQIMFLNNEINRNRYRFVLRDLVIENMDYLKGTDLDTFADIEGQNGNFKNANDYSVFSEMDTNIIADMASAVAKGEVTPQEAIQAHLEELQDTYKKVWGDRKITGNVK